MKVIGIINISSIIIICVMVGFELCEVFFLCLSSEVILVVFNWVLKVCSIVKGWMFIKYLRLWICFCMVFYCDIGGCI